MLGTSSGIGTELGTRLLPVSIPFVYNLSSITFFLILLETSGRYTTNGRKHGDGIYFLF